MNEARRARIHQCLNVQVCIIGRKCFFLIPKTPSPPPSVLQHPFSQKQGTDVGRRLSDVPFLIPAFYTHIQKSD